MPNLFTRKAGYGIGLEVKEQPAKKYLTVPHVWPRRGLGSTFLGEADLIGADKLAQPQRLNKFRAESQKDHLMQV